MPGLAFRALLSEEHVELEVALWLRNPVAKPELDMRQASWCGVL